MQFGNNTYHYMEKKEIIYICTKAAAGILVTLGFFAAVPMVMMAMEIIGARMAPENMELPFTLKRFGLDGIEANTPELLTTYVISLGTTLLAALYALLHALGRATFQISPMKRIEQIITSAVFLVSLCVLVPTTKSILEASKNALLTEKENRNTYMGTQMDEFSKNYLIKNGWALVKHDNCNDSYVRKGEFYTGDQEHPYLDAWNPAGQQVYHAEKRQPVEPGTYRIICSARAEGNGCYIFATTTSKKSGLKLVEVPHYGNTGGELWENAPEGSDIKEANNGEGFGWSKVVVTIEVSDNDTLVFGVTTDSSFTGKPYNSKWFSAADFEVERLNID